MRIFWPSVWDRLFTLAQSCGFRNYTSRLILRPNRPYSATFSSCISSRRELSLASNFSTSASICSVDLDKSSCTSSAGSEKNESPILYLCHLSDYRRALSSEIEKIYGTFSSSSTSSNSEDISSKSSLSFCACC
jgi:hypothetical protein